MRPQSPSPILSPRARKMIMSEGCEGGTRSSSLPPSNRVEFGAHRTLVPCSKEFQKSLNDMRKERDHDVDDVISHERLTLPIITILKQSERGGDVGVVGGSHTPKYSPRNLSDDDSSFTSGNTSSEDDECHTTWTSLSEVGTLKTLQPRRARYARSEVSDDSLNDDVASIRSDSHLITRLSKRSENNLRKKRSESETSGSKRFSRKDGFDAQQRSSVATPQSPLFRPIGQARRFSPLSRPQVSLGISSNHITKPYSSRSANNSPERHSPKKVLAPSGTSSAPTSPESSPNLSHQRAHHTKRINDLSHRSKPHANSMSTSGNYYTNSALNPVIAKVNSTSGSIPASCVNKHGPYSDVVAWNLTKRGVRVAKEAWRLSDLCVEDHYQSPRQEIDLEEEFNRLKECRYLRTGNDDHGNSDMECLKQLP